MSIIQYMLRDICMQNQSGVNMKIGIKNIQGTTVNSHNENVRSLVRNVIESCFWCPSIYFLSH